MSFNAESYADSKYVQIMIEINHTRKHRKMNTNYRFSDRYVAR